MSNELYWPWSVLELPHKGAEKRDVKRAYARVLKTIDVEADPAAFQELRQAYESALSYVTPARRAQKSPPFVEVKPAPVSPPKRVEVVVEKANIAEQEDVSEWQKEQEYYNDTLAQLHLLIKDGNLKVEDWRDLLNRLVHFDFQQSQWFEREFVDGMDKVFAQPWHPTRTAVNKEWTQLVEDRFSWFSDGLGFARRYPEHHKLWNELSRQAKMANFEFGSHQTYERKEEPALLDPKVPWFVRWWAVLIYYFVFLISLPEFF